MDTLHIPIEGYTVFILEIAIILSCLAIMLLAKTIKKYKNANNFPCEIILYIICYYTIFNFMYLENMYFIEAGAMALSVFLYILSAKWIVEKKKLYVVKVFFLLWIALMGYQGTISMFFLSLVVFSIIKNENSIKQVIFDILKGILIALSAILANQLEIKVIEHIFNKVQNRGEIKIATILNNVKFILLNMLNVVKNSAHYLPKYVHIVIISVTELLAFALILKKNKQSPNKKNANLILAQLFILFIGICAAFIVSMMSLTAFWAARIRFSLGAVVRNAMVTLICKYRLYF